MQEQFIDKVKDRMESERDRLLAELNMTIQDYDSLNENAEDNAQDFGDIGQLKADSEKLAQVGMEERRRLRRIRSALARIEQGTYGICLSCGGEIPRGRLEALPEAPLCVECERRLESD